ncbi:MAG TPA: hypothetical protein VF339_17435 [Gammaproteobacteria bacterium]
MSKGRADRRRASPRVRAALPMLAALIVPVAGVAQRAGERSRRACVPPWSVPE